MIRSAILGLEDEAGSTEEAISEFIKKEYSDLPWAHDRILGLQLEKLCEIGEIARVSGWRYVLKAEDEVKEQCEGSEKKKRGKRRSNKRGEAESAEEECKKGRVLELGKQSQQHQEVEPQRGFVESKNQVMQHLVKSWFWCGCFVCIGRVYSLTYSVFMTWMVDSQMIIF